MSKSERSRVIDDCRQVNEAQHWVKEGERRVNEVEHVSLYIITLSLLLSLISSACACTPACVSVPVFVCDRGERRKKSIGVPFLSRAVLDWGIRLRWQRRLVSLSEYAQRVPLFQLAVSSMVAPEPNLGGRRWSLPPDTWTALPGTSSGWRLLSSCCFFC